MKFRLVLLGILSMVLTACSGDASRGRMEVSYTRENIARGRELVRGLGACGFCHGATAAPEALLTGGREQYDLYGEVRAANLTPAKSGLAGWSLEDFIGALRNHQRPDGAKLAQEMHRGAEWLSDQDLAAMFAYLSSLPAREHEVARRDVGFLDRNTTGFFQGSRAVAGYVPPVSRADELTYGRYLSDQLARCGSCHNSPGNLLFSSAYHKGGKVIKTDAGEKVAPSIESSAGQGIGDWSSQDLLAYLRTGQTPDNRYSAAEFCPSGFYRNASEADLKALSAYLLADAK